MLSKIILEQNKEIEQTEQTEPEQIEQIEQTKIVQIEPEQNPLSEFQQILNFMETNNTEIFEYAENKPNRKELIQSYFNLRKKRNSIAHPEVSKIDDQQFTLADRGVGIVHYLASHSE